MMFPQTSTIPLELEVTHPLSLLPLKLKVALPHSLVVTRSLLPLDVVQSPLLGSITIVLLQSVLTGFLYYLAWSHPWRYIASRDFMSLSVTHSTPKYHFMGWGIQFFLTLII
jgi:hypothetical protein